MLFKVMYRVIYSYPTTLKCKKTLFLFVFIKNYEHVMKAHSKNK